MSTLIQRETRWHCPHCKEEVHLPPNTETALARVAELETFESRVYRWCEKRVVTAGVPENADLIDVMIGISERYLDKIEAKDAEIQSLTRQLSESQAQLASAREDSARLDWLEDRALSIELYGGEFRRNRTLNVGSVNIRSAIDSARGVTCPDCAGEPCDAHSPHPSPGEQPCEQREELKPCPFCGGAPRIEQGINEADQAWRIFCANPDCTVIVECQSGFTKEDNINRWNTRS